MDNRYLRIAVGIIAALVAFWVVKAAFSPAFSNYLACSVGSEEVREARKQVGVFGGSIPIDPSFDPWPEIAGTAYEKHYERFTRAANKAHLEAIKADIDCETRCEKGFPTGARKEIWEEYLAKCGN